MVQRISGGYFHLSAYLSSVLSGRRSCDQEVAVRLPLGVRLYND